MRQRPDWAIAYTREDRNNTGGTPVVLATDQDYPEAIVLDATHVYWVYSASGGDGTVMRVHK